MKIQTFNRGFIRQYMLTSSILEDGIRYCQFVNPSLSREVAKEMAIRLAEDYCQQKWYNDRSGYICNEFIAFQEFEKDVRNQHYFYTRGMKAEEDKKRREEDKKRSEEEAKQEQKRRWQNEASRVRDLRKYCHDNNLDFNTENQKALAILKKQSRLAGWLESVAAIAFIGALVMWIFTAIANWMVWLLVLTVSTIVFFVTDAKIDPKLPDDFFEKIKDGTYRF